jgi:hypothetical protein
MPVVNMGLHGAGFVPAAQLPRRAAARFMLHLCHDSFPR